MKTPQHVPFPLLAEETVLHAERCLDLQPPVSKRYICTIYITTQRLIIWRNMHAMWSSFGILGMLFGKPKADQRLLLDINYQDLKAYMVPQVGKLMNKNVLMFISQHGDTAAHIMLYKNVQRWHAWLTPYLAEQAGQTS